jgi:TRAP-type C4-dicarboxylate transport system permease small subunit
LPEVQQSWASSAIPIGSALFVIAELLRLPEALAEARRGPLLDAELKEALEEVEAAHPGSTESGR